jgi:hypothetical protein
MCGRRKIPPEGLVETPDRDAVRRSDGAASPVSVHCPHSHRDRRGLAIAMPIDTRARPTVGSPFRLDDRLTAAEGIDRGPPPSRFAAIRLMANLVPTFGRAPILRGFGPPPTTRKITAITWAARHHTGYGMRCLMSTAVSEARVVGSSWPATHDSWIRPTPALCRICQSLPFWSSDGWRAPGD